MWLDWIIVYTLHVFQETETVCEHDVSMVDALEGSIPSLDGTFIIEPTEGSVDIEVCHIYECIYENISYHFNLIFEWFTVYETLNNISVILENQ